MGFSPALLLMINQVAELAWARDGLDEISRKGVYQLKANLDNLQQRLPAEHIDPNTECVAIAEANRLGALLFLYEICSTKSASSKSSVPSLDVKEKNTYVKRILGLVLEKKANMMRTAALPLWPLFLAGCCAREEEEKVIVLRLFEELNGIRRFGVCCSRFTFCLGTNLDLFLRILLLQLMLSRWSGDSVISLCRMKESAGEPIQRKRKICCKELVSCGNTPWSCWVDGSSA